MRGRSPQLSFERLIQDLTAAKTLWPLGTIFGRKYERKVIDAVELISGCALNQ